MATGAGGARVAMSTGMTDDAIIEPLAHGPLHRFADWPNPDVPDAAIGVYTVWRGDELVYVGISGTSKTLGDKKATGGKGERSRALVTATGERRCESRDGEAAGEPPNQPPVASMAGTGGNSSSVFDDDFPVH